MKQKTKPNQTMSCYDIPHGLCMCCSLWLELLFCFLYAGSFSLPCLRLKPLGWRSLLTIQQCSVNEYILCVMHIILGTWHVVMNRHKSVSLRSFIGWETNRKYVINTPYNKCYSMLLLLTSAPPLALSKPLSWSVIILFVYLVLVG